MDDVAAVSKLFAAFDRSADGFISRDELVTHFSKLAAPGALLRQLNAQTVEAAAEALLKRVDADGDGRIRYVRSSTLDPPIPSLRARSFSRFVKLPVLQPYLPDICTCTSLQVLRFAVESAPSLL